MSYSDDELMEWYNDVLYYNLPQFLTVFDYKFCHPSEIRSVISLDSDDWLKKKNNPYLMANKNNRMKLGKDILANGMYFPIIAVQDEEGIWYGCEGVHRLAALQTVGTPRDRTFLIVHADRKSYCYREDRDVNVQWKICTPYLEHDPYLKTLLDGYGYVNIYGSAEIMTIWNNYLTWLMAEFHYNGNIKPSRLNDDEELFNHAKEKNEWRGI